MTETRRNLSQHFDVYNHFLLHVIGCSRVSVTMATKTGVLIPVLAVLLVHLMNYTTNAGKEKEYTGIQETGELTVLEKLQRYKD